MEDMTRQAVAICWKVPRENFEGHSFEEDLICSLDLFMAVAISYCLLNELSHHNPVARFEDVFSHGLSWRISPCAPKYALRGFLPPSNHAILVSLG